MEQDIKTLLSHLDERNKELKCLYAVDETLRHYDFSIDEVLEMLIGIVPQGLRYTEICAVKITYNEQVFQTDNYKNTELKIKRNITVDGIITGEITVLYTKPVRAEKGIFLKEEQQLINTIAEKIGQFIHYQNLRQSISELNSTNEITSEIDKKPDPLFEWLKEYGLSEAEIDKFLKVKINFKKGETICKQGAFTSYIMILADGLSKNYLEGTQERGFNFKIIKPFDFIGLSSLYGNHHYQFSGSAITPCTIYMIDQEAIKTTIKNNPEFANNIMKWYCRTTEGHLKRLSCLGNKQALGRIAEILLYLAEDVFLSNLIDNRITRKDIAELAGMSTESAVRILSELKKDKILKITNKGIEIAEPRLLNRISVAG